MIGKPTNHVTRSIERRTEAFLGAGIKQLPVLDVRQIALLKVLFPDRCKRLEESEGEHQRYAGKVELVSALEAALNEAARQALGDTVEVSDEDAIDEFLDGEPVR